MILRSAYGVLFACILLTGLVLGQERDYVFSHLDNTNGLSNNQVNAIYKDAKGFLWFGTLAGLNRFDGYQFKVFRHNEGNVNSLPDDFVVGIYEAPDNKMLVETGSGFTIYNPATEQFDREQNAYFTKLGLPVLVTYLCKDASDGFWFLANNEVYHLPGGTTKVQLVKSSKNATWLMPAPDGSVWIAYSNGILEKRTIRDKKPVYRKRIPAQGRLKLFVDAQNEVWVFVTDHPQGVFYLKPQSNELVHFSKGSSVCPLNNNLINGVIQDQKGNIWLATDHGGMNIINKKELSVRYLTNNETDSKSIAQNSLVTLYRDDAGFIWAGTYKRGLSFYNENALRFPLYQHRPFNKNSLPYHDVNRFAEDREGNLWIGTNGGGLIYFNRKTNSFRQYKHEQGNENSLSSDVIVSLCIDRFGKLWIGTYFGGLECFDGKNFRHYRHNDKDSRSIADDKIWEVYEDRQGNLWVGTLTSGLDLFDRESGTFKHFRPNTGNSVHSTYISALGEDKQGNLWIGTANGLDVLNLKTGKFAQIVHKEDDAQSLSNNFVLSLICDRRGLIWVGTRDGLNYYDIGKKRFRLLRMADGLPDNTILNIVEDAGGNIWVSTPNGISKISVSKDKDIRLSFKNYDEADGLQGRAFNENAALRTARNELVFGGPNGFNIFHPERLHAGKKPHKLVFTDFTLFNQSVGIGEEINNDIILEKSVTEVNEVRLKHFQNVFAIEFAALGAANPEKVTYAYMLDGFDKKWLSTNGDVRKATYTNLDPGSYTFKVRASNDDGSWNEQMIQLHVVIKPPFWETGFAYFLYLVLFFGGLYLIRRRGIEKLKKQFALEQERQEARRMHELDMLKIKFFTNVSHEFRTPLSLILAPVERIISQTDEPEKKNQLQLIHRNARRLLNLVNQLLDFRKMEVKELKLYPRKGDLIDFIRDSFYSFSDIADKKHIRFTFRSDIDSFYTEFDFDKVERILFNLLSNAFKFTPNEGAINLEITSRREGDFTKLSIKVTDTGIGIPVDKKDKIFERFFQNETPGSIVNQGSGIGLAITREFVQLHGGSIHVDSEENKGSSFVLEIAFKPISAENAEKVQLVEVAENKPISSANKNPEFTQKRKTVLLVEDNDDFRFYLKDNLRQYFNIVEAANGKEGWQKALSAHPDMIVSDISMPEMTGIELCIKVKSDKRTSHVPIILLTALAGEEQQLKGLETGANDYMTKPFNFEILLSKIRNLVQQQDTMKRTFTKQVDASPVKIEVENADDRFIKHALAELEKNISNADYTVEDFSSDMNMSRVALYKKILALTGKTPTEFIRSFRIKRAAQLLEESQLTVAEIAYQVGFNNPKYFAKYFKTEFGMVPSAYGRRESGDKNQASRQGE